MKRIDELKTEFCTIKGLIPAIGGLQANEILTKPLSNLIAPVEFDKLKAAIETFNKVYQDLKQEISLFAGQVDKQTANQREERNILKTQKTRIVGKISEAYGEGVDGSIFYPQLAEIDSKLNQVESFLWEIERKKSFPVSEKIKTKAEIAFNAGIELAKAQKDYFIIREKVYGLINNTRLLLDIASRQIYSYGLYASHLTDELPKVYGCLKPEEAADLSHDDLLKVTQKTIEEAVKQ